ncbi:YbjN domain-containing protein [Parazoarcus communis]|uniref:YbjN domain-containing protein n=1 Tax=Parazoarcus communis TaxID=41977 RepID=A0A2U8H102_9RHOO|nr:YbjN domain-containing protein [Parazoarcus communis]AWI79602.1 YbjN domain-containing protein [Parazoarcus communis]
MKNVAAQTLAFSSLLLACASPSLAAMIDATDPSRIYEIARGFGSAELGRDGQGDPRIVGRIDGTKYGIYFYGCRKGKDCDDIQFSAGWSGTKVSLEKINRWNLEKRYGKAYLDRDGDPRLEMVVNIDYGVSTRNLEDSFNWWTKAMESFKEEVLQ